MSDESQQKKKEGEPDVWSTIPDWVRAISEMLVLVEIKEERKKNETKQ